MRHSSCKGVKNLSVQVMLLGISLLYASTGIYWSTMIYDHLATQRRFQDQLYEFQNQAESIIDKLYKDPHNIWEDFTGWGVQYTSYFYWKARPIQDCTGTAILTLNVCPFRLHTLFN